MWPEQTPEAIIWDLDGTLVDSAPDLAHSLNRLLQQSGRDTLDLDAVRGMIGGGAPRLVECGFRATGSALDHDGLESAVQQFLEIYRLHATDSTRLRSGVSDALEAFKHAGLRQGVCTNKPENISRQILLHLGLGDFFQVIAGGNTTAQKKPAPDALIYCLERLSVQPGQALMIGDSAADAGAARSAGVPIILVRGGYSRDPLEKLDTDAVAADFSSLQKMVLGKPNADATA